MTEPVFRGRDRLGREVFCDARVKVCVKRYAKWASDNSIRNIPEGAVGKVDRRITDPDGEVRVTVELPKGLAQGIYKTHQIEVLS